MLTGDAEVLTRWVLSLQDTIRQVETELARPLRSPSLRCACAVFQMARLCRVVSDGLVIAMTGLSLAHDKAGVGNICEAKRTGRVACSAAWAVGRAGCVALHATGRACLDGWSAWSAARAAPRPPTMQVVRKTLFACRAALFVVGEHNHDRI